jgi:tetratricopeptide (TPR) repeat protein
VIVLAVPRVESSGRAARRVLRATITAAALSLLLAAGTAFGSDDDVDYVALGAQLLRDGHYERAAEMLAKVDPTAEGTDLVTYHTARGMVALEGRQQAEAAQAFADAIAAGQSDPLIHLYRAQALFGLDQFEDALAALDLAGEGVHALTASWLMRAHAQWMLGRRQDAMDTLSRAGTQFPGNTAFERRQVFYLIEAGLFQQAADLGRQYLAHADAKAADYAAIGSALRQSRSYDEALRFLERARLRFPDDGAIAKALAQTWLARGDVRAAAELLAGQAEREPELLPEAAELMRRAGQGVRALALNSRISDQEKKLKQRVGLLLELRRYEQVAGMEDALFRVGLLADEDVRYALAYSRFRGGDFEAAEIHLAALKRPELFRKATELRRLMQDCADSRWSCS